MIGSFWPEVLGGPSQSVYFMARLLCGEGHNVKIICFTTDRELIGEEGDFGLEIMRFRRGWLGYMRALIALGQDHSGVWYINSIFFPFSIAAICLANILCKPVIVAPRGELMVGALGSNNKIRLKKIWLNLVRILYRNAKFHCTNQDELAQLPFIPKKSFVAPNFFDRSLFLDRVRELSAVASRERSFFLVLARIDPKKCHLEIILGFAEYVRCGGDKDLVFAGPVSDIGYFDTCKRLISDKGLKERVIFDGLLDFREKTTRVYNAIGVIYITQGENFGNVVVESLLMGTPVLCSLVMRETFGSLGDAVEYTEHDSASVASSLKSIEGTRANEGQLMTHGSNMVDRLHDSFSELDAEIFDDYL